MSGGNKIVLVEGNEPCKDVCLHEGNIDTKKKEKKPKVTVDSVSCGLLEEQSGTLDTTIGSKEFPGRNRMLLQSLTEQHTENNSRRVCCGIALEKYWKMCPKCGKDVM